MHVSKIVLRNVMSHTDTTLVLPASGVVLVTGPNGSGKSSIVEAVSLALWGKSIRGGHLWSGETGEVEVSLSDRDLAVRRTLTKTRTKLAHGPCSAATWAAHDTATKAQLELDALVPPFDLWRRTAVFCSADVATFTTATDAERKRLLETILGLERFDRAADLARAEARRYERALQAAQSAVQTAASRVTDAESALARLEALQSEDLEALRADEVALIYTLECLADEAHEAQTYFEFVAAKRRPQLAAMEAAVAALRQRQRAVQAQSCPTCARVVDDVFRATEGARIDAELAAAVAEFTHAQDTAERLRAQYAEAEASVTALRARQRETDLALVLLRTRLTAAVRAADAIQHATDELQRRRQDVADAGNVLRTAELEALNAAAVAQVFGMGGVRAHLLSGALVGASTVADAWLQRLAGNRAMSVRLVPAADAKASIALEIGGAGHGYGYRNTSGGERRRIDVALMLALAEVAAAAHNSKPGTLFLDEVFDALDDDGVDALVDVLADLSTDRAVVCITHNPAIVQRVTATARWAVQAGVVTVT